MVYFSLFVPMLPTKFRFERGGVGKAAGRTLREAGALREYKQSAGKRGTLEEEHALLAWPDGGIRGCRRGGANMGRRRAGFGASCWRGPTVDQGFAG